MLFVPHDHIGWTTQMSFTSINSINPRTNSKNLHEKILRLGGARKWVFFTVLHYKIKAQSRNFNSSAIGERSVESQIIVTPLDNPTMEQQNETNWSRLLNRLLKACCLIVWQWHKEELKQKKNCLYFHKTSK